MFYLITNYYSTFDTDTTSNLHIKAQAVNIFFYSEFLSLC